MKIHYVTQGSDEWRKLRAGKVTASNFSDAIARIKNGDPAYDRKQYMYKVVAERLLGRPLEDVTGGLYWINWGKAHEDQAADQLAAELGVTLELVGFITTDDDWLGCSPDRIVANGPRNARVGVEIKCPAPWTIIDYLLNGLGDKYKAQLQGQMLIGGFDLIHFYAWYPGLPAFHIITERDQAYILTLRAELGKFCEDVEQAVGRIRTLMQK